MTEPTTPTPAPQKAGPVIPETLIDATIGQLEGKHGLEYAPDGDTPAPAATPNPQNTPSDDVSRELARVLPKEVIEALSPEHRDAAAAALKGRRSEQDRNVQRLLSEGLARQSDEEQTTGDQAAPATEPAGTPAKDLEALRSKLADALSLGTEDLDALTGYLDAIVQPIVAENKRLRSQTVGTSDAVAQLLEGQARQRLAAGGMPELVDEEAYNAKVAPKVGMLLRSGGYRPNTPQGMDSLLSDAYLLAYGRRGSGARVEGDRRDRGTLTAPRVHDKGLDLTTDAGFAAAVRESERVHDVYQ